ncbi:NAD-dependent dehydratase [Salegentibacter salinarum]|uniref:NAD-dependent dehydratase n=1 Tax=Salegentibacter salinarum TaxID=447422 RepID=A0A2N0TNA9_9FLAO|nr:NAD-dependent epimerase/dehydratase family protein [Salegentibacter salinarum]PKD16206.1 NAD-dependent dehydratase [Salegentibacter salinarum]SKB67945.1 dTDP-glucose 4,6-dehydratase [Salegentibacter salinarum]
MKTILITGAAGFIGSHLCDRFLNEGYRVLGMDNFITGSPANIDHLADNPNFIFYENDIIESIDVQANVDYILHFASPASPIDYLKIPIETLRVGAMGSYNVLELARIKNAKVLIASTSEVYGDPLSHPQKEEYLGNVNTIGPRGVYDEAKRYMEAITMAYHTTYNLPISIIRIFNTYGPRMRLNDGRVIPAFLGQVLNNEPLSIFGDGSQTRSFCYIDDLVEGIYTALFNDYPYPINLGNPEEITINELSREIIKIAGEEKEILFKPLPKGDPVKRKPDTSVARKILNWEPITGRDKGLRLTLDYFKNLSNPTLLNKNPRNFEPLNM